MYTLMVKRLLFVCIGNSARSQMAEGFARHLAPKGVLVRSGGLKPADRVHPLAVELMAERGIDISRHRPKEVDLAFARSADHIIVMGCDPQEACPAEVLERVESWDLPEPSGMDREGAQALRDEIERRVRLLLENL
jgi:protein-tyrosine-phosphatase